MLSVYHWLVAQGLYHYILAWTVATILTWLLARRKYRLHRKTQAHIADALDTSTPGGLTDVLDAIVRHADTLNDLSSINKMHHGRDHSTS